MTSHTFQFEADFVDSLRCIPMQVRLKLDISGIKLSLAQWHQFSEAQRQQLVEMPCDTPSEIAQYRTTLQNWILSATDQPAKELAVPDHFPWEAATVPDSVQQQAATFDYHIADSQWQQLEPVQRFALIKLSRPGHENKNFQPAMAEFGLA
ncbi:nitrate reductase associated protein [filamentous cyanobacterium CCP5]|nr:nitrate reductase associated protein [filamentous cyanobacterium CCP5]